MFDENVKIEDYVFNYEVPSYYTKTVLGEGAGI